MIINYLPWYYQMLFYMLVLVSKYLWLALLYSFPEQRCLCQHWAWQWFAFWITATLSFWITATLSVHWFWYIPCLGAVYHVSSQPWNLMTIWWRVLLKWLASDLVDSFLVFVDVWFWMKLFWILFPFLSAEIPKFFGFWTELQSFYIQRILSSHNLLCLKHWYTEL